MAFFASPGHPPLNAAGRKMSCAFLFLHHLHEPFEAVRMEKCSVCGVKCVPQKTTSDLLKRHLQPQGSAPDRQELHILPTNPETEALKNNLTKMAVSF